MSQSKDIGFSEFGDLPYGERHLLTDAGWSDFRDLQSKGRDSQPSKIFAPSLKETPQQQYFESDAPPEPLYSPVLLLKKPNPRIPLSG